MILKLRHYGPAPHKSGTPQSVHGKGGMGRWKAAEEEKSKATAEATKKATKTEKPWDYVRPPRKLSKKAAAAKAAQEKHAKRLDKVTDVALSRRAVATTPETVAMLRVAAEMGTLKVKAKHSTNAYEDTKRAQHAELLEAAGYVKLKQVTSPGTSLAQNIYTMTAAGKKFVADWEKQHAPSGAGHLAPSKHPATPSKPLSVHGKVGRRP